MARHVESVAESGATSIVATRQGVVEPRSIRRKKWSRIVVITAACHVEPATESDGAAQNLLEEVEQSRGCCCSLPGGPGLSAKVQLECLAERGG